ncbi:hypothetical protein [Natronolimnobius baerhuensis]|uniref:Uncharacterized protein n=1 Tax=Natronolimnobius baerhuensis TaxID=253108 RepID=A0A202E9Z5_9EURY|nr:hypothetical protein [Natronolimnobius baerhuensis]OVE84978.1 hypothetical protein B2G88_11515 [Natronolimnobius baerhuensis]
MDRIRLYHAAVILAGTLVGVNGLATVLADGLGLTAGLLAVGGFGMAGSSGYLLFVADDPAETVPDGWRWWGVVLGATLVIVSAVAQLLR